MKMTAKANYAIDILTNISASETWKSEHWCEKHVVLLLNIHWTCTHLKGLPVTALKFDQLTHCSYPILLKLISIWDSFPGKGQHSVLSLSDTSLFFVRQQRLEAQKSGKPKRSTPLSAWHSGAAWHRESSVICSLLFWLQKKRCCQPHLEGYSTFLLIRCSFHSIFLFYYNPVPLVIIFHCHSYIVNWTYPDNFDPWKEQISSCILQRGAQPLWRKMMQAEEEIKRPKPWLTQEPWG